MTDYDIYGIVMLLIEIIGIYLGLTFIFNMRNKIAHAQKQQNNQDGNANYNQPKYNWGIIFNVCKRIIKRLKTLCQPKKNDTIP